MISRTAVTVTKYFYVLIVCSIITYILIDLNYLRYAYQADFELITKWNDIKDGYQYELQKKYILFDTDSVLDSFIDGDQMFKDYQCPQANCYVTTNKKVLGKKYFDAVVINASELEHADLPTTKPKNQRYIFFADNPFHRPICRSDVDHYFDYTWSYKYSSDIVSPVLVVEHLNGTVVSPKPHINWIMDKNALFKAKDFKFMKKKMKSKAVAMVDRSSDDEDGKLYAYRLRESLNYYHLNLHNFKCGNKERSDILKAYYFILVSEGTSQDYITDKVMNVYLNNTVPIIRAHVDLTMLLPTGSYIDARLQTPDQIAEIVHACTSRSNNRTIYKKFFRWKHHYIFRRRRDYEGICQLCSLLHRTKHPRPNTKVGLREWWNNDTSKKCEKELK